MKTKMMLYALTILLTACYQHPSEASPPKPVKPLSGKCDPFKKTLLNLAQSQVNGALHADMYPELERIHKEAGEELTETDVVVYGKLKYELFDGLVYSATVDLKNDNNPRTFDVEFDTKSRMKMKVHLERRGEKYGSLGDLVSYSCALSYYPDTKVSVEVLLVNSVTNRTVVELHEENLMGEVKVDVSI